MSLNPFLAPLSDAVLAGRFVSEETADGARIERWTLSLPLNHTLCLTVWPEPAQAGWRVTVSYERGSQSFEYTPIAPARSRAEAAAIALAGLSEHPFIERAELLAFFDARHARSA